MRDSASSGGNEPESQRSPLISRGRRHIIQFGRGRLLILGVLFRRPLEHPLKRALDRRAELGGVINLAGTADARSRALALLQGRYAAGTAARGIEHAIWLSKSGTWHHEEKQGKLREKAHFSGSLPNRGSTLPRRAASPTFPKPGSASAPKPGSPSALRTWPITNLKAERPPSTEEERPPPWPHAPCGVTAPQPRSSAPHDPAAQDHRRHWLRVRDRRETDAPAPPGCRRTESPAPMHPPRTECRAGC